MKPITFTTDFGTTDWFVGTMKGVVLSIQPRATLIDLTHGIAPGDIRAGAFALAAACRFFPPGTIHVAVVDPGVGSPRRALGVQTERGWFLGPDNGLLSWALRHEKIESVRSLENERYFLHPVSRTFHGRDIFAPVAAHLSRGVPLREFGPEEQTWVQLSWPQPHIGPHEIAGEILYLDRFGNAITNLPGPVLAAPAGTWRLCVRGRPVGWLRRSYADIPQGEAGAVLSSSGLLEVAVQGGSAAATLRLKPGAAVTLRRHLSSPA